MKIKGILLDLDGTVLNTNDLIVTTFQYTLKKVLNLQIEREDIVNYFGEPLLETMQKFSPEQAELLVNTYRAYNSKYHNKLVKIFPGVKETILSLKSKGYSLAIVTSKRNAMALQGLDLFGLTSYMDTFVGHDDTEIHKPNPEPALKALKNLELKPQEALMIGDSPFDILCGKNAGTYTAVVKYTEHSLDRLLRLRPDYVIENLSEVISILENS